MNLHNEQVIDYKRLSLTHVTASVGDLPPYQPHYEEEVSSLWPAVARRCAAAVDSLLGKYLPPDDQLTHTLLRGQWQQAVVLAVQAHIQQVLFRQVVGDQVGLEDSRSVEGLNSTL